MLIAKNTVPLSSQFLLAAAACLGVGACAAVGPDYVPPSPELPDLWATEMEEELSSDPAILARWWTQLEDPLLTDLIARAHADNLDLAQGLSRVNEARALRGIAGVQGLPDIDLTGNATRSDTLGALNKTKAWQANFEMAWELDVAGGVRRNEEAAIADLQATQESLRDVRVLIAAEVASTYVDVRNFQARLVIAEQNIETQRESLEIAQQRLEQGTTSALDTAQAESNLANTEANVPSLVIGLRRSMHRLAVLLGQNPSSLYGELEAILPVPSVPEEIALGIPANLLRQRADLRGAERELAAQTARVGVATAELYPRFFLPGSAGIGAIDGQIFTPNDSTELWSIGVGFSWNVFDFGRVRRNIDVQEERVNQALLNYESTLLIALEEVENALVSYSRQGVRRAALGRAVAATQRSVDLSNQRYTEGIDDFQRVLDAERSLFNLEDTLQVSAADHTQALISVYLALGGGWQSEEDLVEE